MPYEGNLHLWAAMRIPAILQKSARVQALRAENIRTPRSAEL